MSRRPVVPLSFTRHGDASRPAVILLQGLGMASNAWPAELVDALVETGLQVVLPDNRDAGKSPRVTGVRVRDVEVLGAVARTLARRKVSAAYDLDDMADDVVALADGLGIGRFHVAGFSMGGMIAQTLALRHPERILSLASSFVRAGPLGRMIFPIVPSLPRPVAGLPVADESDASERILSG